MRWVKWYLGPSKNDAFGLELQVSKKQISLIKSNIYTIKRIGPALGITLAWLTLIAVF